GRGAPRASADRPRARGEADRPCPGTARRTRFGAGRSHARTAQGRRRARGTESHGPDRRGLQGVCDDGGDVRRAARGLGRVARDACFLVCADVLVSGKPPGFPEPLPQVRFADGRYAPARDACFLTPPGKPPFPNLSFVRVEKCARFEACGDTPVPLFSLPRPAVWLRMPRLPLRR